MLIPLRIWYLKRKLKKAVLLRRSIAAAYDCSPSILAQLSPSIASLDIQIQTLLGTLRTIDPTCP